VKKIALKLEREERLKREKKMTSLNRSEKGRRMMLNEGMTMMSGQRRRKPFMKRRKKKDLRRESKETTMSLKTSRERRGETRTMTKSPRVRREGLMKMKKKRDRRRRRRLE